MAKVTLPSLPSGYELRNTANANFGAIEAILNDNVLWRANPTGEPNSLQQDLDFNNNDALNIGTLGADTIIAQGQDLTQQIAAVLVQAPLAIQAATDAVNSAGGAAASATAASDSAVSAGRSESAALASEIAAAASQSAAATSESNAATSATAASVSEANAAASEAVVLASEANVTAMEAIVQSLSEHFRGTYYGALASDPTVDPLGNPPTTGDLYFNTTTNTLRLFDGSTWNLASVDSSTLGTASTYDVGTAAGQVPLNQDLGSASQADIATLADAVAGVAGKIPDSAQVHSAFGQYGLGNGLTTALAISSGDITDFTTSGWFYCSSAVTGVPEAQFGLVMRLYRGATRKSLFYYSNSGRVYYRNINGANDTGWLQVQDSSTMATSAEALAGTDLTKWMSAARVHEAFNQFGFGANSAKNVNTDFTILDSPLTPNGFYEVTTPGWTSAPPGTSQYRVIHIRHSNNGGYATQIAFGFSGGRAFIRTAFNSLTFGQWAELYHSGNILGTVSQSGGVPTGAIIERGSNANGKYTKFADGTMICRIKFGVSAVNTATFTLQGINYYRIRDDWTFPSAFIDITNLSISALAEQNSDDLLVTTKTRSVTTAGVSIDSVSATSFSSFARTSLYCTAIGRWY